MASRKDPRPTDTPLTPKSNDRYQMADLARLAGVSTSTVSRALADNPLIKEATRQKNSGTGAEPELSSQPKCRQPAQARYSHHGIGHHGRDTAYRPLRYNSAWSRVLITRFTSPLTTSDQATSEQNGHLNLSRRRLAARYTPRATRTPAVTPYPSEVTATPLRQLQAVSRRLCLEYPKKSKPRRCNTYPMTSKQSSHVLIPTKEKSPQLSLVEGFYSV